MSIKVSTPCRPHVWRVSRSPPATPAQEVENCAGIKVANRLVRRPRHDGRVLQAVWICYDRKHTKPATRRARINPHLHGEELHGRQYPLPLLRRAQGTLHRAVARQTTPVVGAPIWPVCTIASMDACQCWAFVCLGKWSAWLDSNQRLPQSKCGTLTRLSYTQVIGAGSRN